MWSGLSDGLCVCVAVSMCGQDLVMGSDAAGEKVKDHVKHLAPLLQDKNILASDKIRLILLYIIQKGGDTYRIEYFSTSQHD